MKNLLELLGRKQSIFKNDIKKNNKKLSKIIKNSNFLIIGGGGSIGRATSKEIFKRKPKLLHLVDISENNLVECVRDLRSSIGYTKGEFKTFSLDCGSKQFEKLIKGKIKYDYVINLSALKHVRSERDKFTLSRMIEVNILNVMLHLNFFKNKKIKKYFCVSSDKATNPVNFMGASKRIMEILLVSKKNKFKVSLARFANVIFSDGSLLDGFKKRLEKNQPLTAPKDIKRYFITPQEAGELCMLCCIFGKDREVFFPNDKINLIPIRFSDIAKRYLKYKGYVPKILNSEQQARNFFKLKKLKQKFWPCLFFNSDTSGEKSEEEFYENKNDVNFKKFKNIGIINLKNKISSKNIIFFEKKLRLSVAKCHDKSVLKKLFSFLLNNFNHIEKRKSLDEKM